MPDRRLIQFARNLRRDSTDAERRMWYYLRGNKLGGYSFRRQHPIGCYIADFYCHQAKLVVELDGDQHADPEVVEYDRVRTESFRTLGIDVIRFSDYDALKHSEAVAATVLRELEKRVGQARMAPTLALPREYAGEGTQRAVSAKSPAFIPSPGTPGEG